MSLVRDFLSIFHTAAILHVHMQYREGRISINRFLDRASRHIGTADLLEECELAEIRADLAAASDMLRRFAEANRATLRALNEELARFGRGSAL